MWLKHHKLPGLELRSKHKSDATNQCELLTGNIYLLPNKKGMLFALLLAVMLAGSINYSNSLGFVLTFLLASLITVSVFHTHKNLYRLRIKAGSITNAYCGDQASIPIILENPGRNRFSVNVASAYDPGDTIDINSNSFTQLRLRHKAAQRGWQYIDQFTVATTFPLGLFKAWSRIRLNARFLVYPKPAQATAFLQLPTYTPKHSGDKGRGSDDFAGFRNYNRGDNLAHIHWKAVARNQGLYIKQFGGDRSDEIWLDWNTLTHLNKEQKLSVLTRWIIDAEQKGIGYGLVLPHKRFEPAHGTAHKTRCLTALALF